MPLKKLLFVLFAITPIHMAIANPDIDTATVNDEPIIPASELLARDADQTPCATAAFADALAAKLINVSSDASEEEVKGIIYNVFSDGPTLDKVLACPEITNTPAEDSIKFMPIEYKFPGDRRIVINYETQPKILQHRQKLANKKSLPSSDPSPRLGDLDDASVWTNTDPAWYAIMVTESGALDEFVGDGKNNTISLKYIEDNIDRMIPQSSQCTSGSALANDHENINDAMRDTVGIGDDDSNDYYVADDVNLQWISYLEIGLDVVITVVTFGGGAVISGVTKAARAARVLQKLGTGIRALAKTESVTEYIRLAQKYKKMTDKITQLKKLHDATTVEQYMKTNNRLRKLLRERNALSASDPKYAKVSENYLKALDEWIDLMKKNQDLGREIANVSDVDDIAKTMRNMEKTDKKVKQFNESTKTYSDLNKYRHKLLALKRPAQRGNIARRGWRSFRASATGTKKINQAADVVTNTEKLAGKNIKKIQKELTALEKAEQTAETTKRISRLTKELKVLEIAADTRKPVKGFARVSQKGTRLRNWLFHSSMKSANKLARLEQKAGLLYGAIKVAGEMYDWTETSTGEFTNDIEFKPLLLLSADDIEGQENKVNYGMWLMWQGDTYSEEDDDAAYLQAMDFAEEFHRNLLNTQDTKNDYSCNVDIYVVRPILRNPDSDDAELYYLIMNDVPWSTK